MPLCHKTKQAFIHIPKCGGTTIEKRYGLDKPKNFYSTNPSHYVYSGVHYAPQHLTPELLSQKVEDWQSFNTFCFVRNPYEKMVSEYFYIHKHFENELIREFKNKEFQRWIHQEGAPPKRDHMLSQWSYAKDCRHVFALSNINQEIPKIDRWFGAQSSAAQKHNISPTYKYFFKMRKVREIAKYLTPTSRRLIRDIYHDDFKHLQHVYQA